LCLIWVIGMKKFLKISLYSLFFIGAVGILFVMARSVIDPDRTQARIEQNDKSARPVLGQLITLNPRPPRPDVPFLDANGDERTLAEFEGKVILLNIWATWCVPCVEEMPSLDQLQAKLGGADFEVVAISEDRVAADAKAFYVEHNLKNLAFYQDKSFGVVRQLYVKDYPTGLPISVLYDREGRELARLSGGFDWVSETAITRINQAISAP